MPSSEHGRVLSLIETASSPGLNAATRDVAFEELFKRYGKVALKVLKTILSGSSSSTGITPDDLNVMAMESIYYAVRECDTDLIEKFPGLIRMKALSISRDVLRNNRLIKIPAWIQDELSKIFFDDDRIENPSVAAGLKAMAIAEDDTEVPGVASENLQPEEILLFFEDAGLITPGSRKLIEAKLFPDPDRTFRETVLEVAEGRGISQDRVYQKATSEALFVAQNLELILDILRSPKREVNERFKFGSLCTYMLHQFSFKPKETIRLTERILATLYEDSGAKSDNILELKLALSIMYRKTKRLDKAEKLLEDPLTSPIHAAEAHSQLGEICFKRGLVEQASIHFKKAIEIDGTTLGRRASLGKVLLRQGDFDGAIENFTAELKIWPSDKVARYLLAKTYFKSSDFVLFDEIKDERRVAALNILDELIKGSPKDYRNYLLKFDILVRQRRFSEAGSTLDLALINAPDKPEVFTRYARLSLLVGDPKAALEHARRAYGLDPRDQRLEYFLGRVASKI